MASIFESLKSLLFSKTEILHPKLIEADRDLLQHAAELRKQSDAVHFLDQGTALQLLDHAQGLCDEVLKRPQNGLCESAQYLRNSCLQDKLDREYGLYKRYSDPAKYQEIIQGYQQLAQKGHEGAAEKLSTIQHAKFIEDVVSSDVEGYTSFDELTERRSLTPTR